MHQIPKRNADLRRYVLLKDIRRCVLYALWCGFWFYGIWFYNVNREAYPDGRQLSGWRFVALIVFVLVIGFFLFRMQKFFTQRTLAGKILQSNITHSYTYSEDPGLFNGIKYDYRLKTALIVQTEDGKQKKIRFEQKMGSYQSHRVGEYIIRFHGLAYPINPTINKESGYMCVACGRFHKQWQPHCAVCEHSLIHPDDIKNIVTNK